MDTVFPCLFGVSVFLIVFGFFAFLRFLKYKETLALAEKGLVYPERRNGKDSLRWGIVITAVGLALILGLLPVAWRGMWPFLLFGLIPTFFGLALVLIYVLTYEKKPKAPEPPAVPENIEPPQ